MKALFISLAILSLVNIGISDVANAKRFNIVKVYKSYNYIKKSVPSSFVSDVIVGGGSAMAGAYLYDKMTEETEKQRNGQLSKSQETKNTQPIKEERNDN